MDEWNQKIALDEDCPIPTFEEYDPATPVPVSSSRSSKSSKNGTIKQGSIKTTSGDKKSVRVKVLYDYEARDEDEIPLRKGAFLDEIKPEDDQGERA